MQTAAANTHPTTAHSLACMEIWGGNESVDQALSTPGLDVWVHSRPYKGAAAGGDIHYVSMCASGRIARVSIADVSGHGEKVASAGRILRDLMRKNINTLDQSRFARDLNETFHSEGDNSDTVGLFATALLATYYAPTDHLLLVNAGHPKPILYCAKRKQWHELDQHDEECDRPGDESDLPRNLPIGIITPTEYEQFAVKLERGDLVLLLTDGVIEAAGLDGEQLGTQGLIGMLGSLDPSRPETLIQSLLARLDEFRAGRAANDDISLVLLHHNGAEPPRYSFGEQLTALAKTIGLMRV